MKELSVEQKAIAYDEAIERAKEWYNNPNSSSIGKSYLYAVFPELGESKDERIRKWLISYFKDVCDNVSEKEKKGVLAWLEKQGKKPNPVLDIEIPFGAKDSELQEASYYIPEGFHAEIEGNRIIIKRGKQKSADKVEPKFKVGDRVRNIKNGKESVISEMLEYVYGGIIPFYIKDQDEWELVEQKSWSEEDEINLGHIIRIIGRLYDKQEKNYLKESLEGKINWLKSLKDRVQPQPQQEWTEDDRIRIANCIQLIGKTGDGEVEWLKALESRILPQPKQEWTEEDKKMRAAILQLITDSEKENGWNCVYCNDKEIYFSDIIAWLKFFIPQSHWKPTDEQISLLEELVEDNNQRHFYNILRTLYEQLKKLREE